MKYLVIFARIVSALMLTLLVAAFQAAQAQPASTQSWPCDIVMPPHDEAMEYPVFTHPDPDWNKWIKIRYMLPYKDTNTFFLIGYTGDSTVVYHYNPMKCILEGPGQLLWSDEDSNPLGEGSNTFYDSKNDIIYSSHWKKGIFRVDYKNKDNPFKLISDESFLNPVFFHPEEQRGLIFGKEIGGTSVLEMRVFDPNKPWGKMITLLPQKLPVISGAGTYPHFFDPHTQIFYQLIYKGSDNKLSGEVVTCDLSAGLHKTTCKKNGEDVGQVIPDFANKKSFSSKTVWDWTNRIAYIFDIMKTHEDPKIYVYNPKKKLHKRFELVTELPFSSKIRYTTYNPGDDRVWFTDNDNSLHRFNLLKDKNIIEHQPTWPKNATLYTHAMVFDPKEDKFFYFTEGGGKNSLVISFDPKVPLLANPMKLETVIPKVGLFTGFVRFFDAENGKFYTLNNGDKSIFEIRLHDKENPVIYKGQGPFKMYWSQFASNIAFWDQENEKGIFFTLNEDNKKLSRKLYVFDPHAAPKKMVTELGNDVLEVAIDGSRHSFFEPKERILYLINYTANVGTKKTIECDLKDLKAPTCKETGEEINISHVTSHYSTLLHPETGVAYLYSLNSAKTYDPTKPIGKRYSPLGFSGTYDMKFWTYDKNRNLIWLLDDYFNTMWSVKP